MICNISQDEPQKSSIDRPLITVETNSPTATVTSLAKDKCESLSSSLIEKSYYIPPLRFGIVNKYLYRGAYPVLRNFHFLSRLKVIHKYLIRYITVIIIIII